MIKKKILTSVMTLAIAVTTYSSALAYVPVGEDYHIAFDKNETDYVLKNKLGGLQRSEYLEKNIQAPLIKYNPQKVWKSNSKYADGLKEVYIKPVGNVFDSDDSGYNHGSGYISLTRGSLFINSAPVYGSNKVTLTPKDYNVYALSAIASDYAHECGHWYYDDAFLDRKFNQTREIADKESIKVEARADAFGIRLLENVPQFSVGGDLISVYRMAQQTGWNGSGKTHPTNISRWNATYKYICQMADGRVNFYNESSHENRIFYIKDSQGEKWEIVTPPQFEVANFVNVESKKQLYTAHERANYVIGQVAWAIKNNCWDANHVTIEDGSKYFKDIPKGDITIKVIVARKNSREYKIIDWVGISKVQTKKYYTQEQEQEVDDYVVNLLLSTGFRA